VFVLFSVVIVSFPKLRDGWSKIEPNGLAARLCFKNTQPGYNTAAGNEGKQFCSSKNTSKYHKGFMENFS